MTRSWASDLVQHFRGGLAWHTGPAPVAEMAQVDYEDYWRRRGVPEPEPPSPSEIYDYPRFEAIAARVAPGERIADLGCGGGALLAFLKERGHDDVVGVDPSGFAVEALTGWGYDARCSTLEALNPSDLGPLDVAVLADVLEHVVAFETVLDKVANHARRVIISHPNIGFWPHRWRLLSGRFPLQWGWHPGEHVRYFTVIDLLEYLDRAGYEVISIAQPLGVPIPWLRRSFPNLFASNVVLEVTKRGQPGRSDVAA